MERLISRSKCVFAYAATCDAKGRALGSVSSMAWIKICNASGRSDNSTSAASGEASLRCNFSPVAHSYKVAPKLKTSAADVGSHPDLSNSGAT